MVLRLTGVFLIVTATAAEAQPLSAQDGFNAMSDGATQPVYIAETASGLIQQMGSDGSPLSGNFGNGSFSDLSTADPLSSIEPLSHSNLLDQ